MDSSGYPNTRGICSRRARAVQFLISVPNSFDVPIVPVTEGGLAGNFSVLPRIEKETAQQQGQWEGAVRQRSLHAFRKRISVEGTQERRFFIHESSQKCCDVSKR